MDNEKYKNLPPETSFGAASKTDVQQLFVLFLVSVSLCVALYYGIQSKNVSEHKDSMATYTAYCYGLEHYKTMRQEWRPRLFSNYLASLFFRSGRFHSTEESRKADFAIGAGWWHAVWLFAINLVWIAWNRNNALLFMLVTFACLLSAYTGLGGKLGHRPWDMPILFFSTLAVFCWARQKTAWLVFILPLACGFKETAVLFTLLLLSGEHLSLRRKVFYFLLTLLLCLLVKLSIDFIMESPHLFYTMTTSDAHLKGRSRLSLNLILLSSRFFFIFITVNVGTVLLLLLLPLERKIVVLKLIAGLFSAGIFMYGMIFEFRIWFELIPVAMGGVEVWSNNDLKRRLGFNPPSSVKQNSRRPE